MTHQNYVNQETLSLYSFVHSGYKNFCQYMCSLGIESTTFALLTQCSTTEPQEHYLNPDL